MILYSIIAILAAFLSGYIIGKRYGWQMGYKEAEAAMPLKIRQQSLEAGKCTICQGLWLKVGDYDKLSRDLDTL